MNTETPADAVTAAVPETVAVPAVADAQATVSPNEQTAAPGSSEPPKRVDFPPLVAAGGQFKDNVHFVSSLTPTSVSEWPCMYEPDPANPSQALVGADGKPVVKPLPWEEHNTSAYYALTKDKFDTEVGYFYYRAWLMHKKLGVAIDDMEAAKNGGLRDAKKLASKAERMVRDLQSMAGALAGVEGVDINALLAALGQKQEAAKAAAEAEAAKA